MTDILVRETAPGRWIAGEPVERNDRLSVRSPGSWAASPEIALRAALRRRGTEDTPAAPDVSEAKPARTRGDKSRLAKGLTPQGVKVLPLLVEKGEVGLTAREARPLCDSLRDRVRDFRFVFGADAVETTWESNGNGGRHARYIWRGPDSVQLEVVG